VLLKLILKQYIHIEVLLKHVEMLLKHVEMLLKHVEMLLKLYIHAETCY
jgi:hypothetical protein